MSIENWDNTARPGVAAAWSPRSPAERVLMALKMHGALSSAELGSKLATTGEAARQQLARLAEEGLVASASEARGVGRPTQRWSLTAAAQSRFPDTHAALTVQLLDIVRTSLGEAALETLISVREAETHTAYHSVIAADLPLRDKVAALADLRSAEGYMAGWSEEPDGTLVLVENHCPICAAATACQGFCRAELDVFRSILGSEATIQRTEHIVSGGRRCTYSIRKTDA
ncbi:helix-turn-helix transcriptional regulator [Devosia psychrophila]|nr:metalloregulator ArsR/SmtB family transcription factor [Devosia psychrophila]